MKIGVCIKRVPATDTRIKISDPSAGVDLSDVTWKVNPYDFMRCDLQSTFSCVSVLWKAWIPLVCDYVPEINSNMGVRFCRMLLPITLHEDMQQERLLVIGELKRTDIPRC